jgi:alpha-L-fucosidase
MSLNYCVDPRCLRTSIIAVALAAIAGGWPGRSAADEPRKDASPEAVAQWRQLKFGLFIHWGPVSLKGTEISWTRGTPIPIDEYDNLYKRFNPVKFNADQWAAVAKDAGVKYVVLTTKHHDGFCLFDTKQTDYNIMHSPFGRDVTKELAEACRKQGLRFGTYYSTCDWHHPDFPWSSVRDWSAPLDKYSKPNDKPHPNLDRYEQYLCKQVAELIHNYGPLSTVWFDVPQGFDARRGQRVVNFVRSQQPHILVNNRTGAAGDYDTPEQSIGGMQTVRPWETCMTIGQQWSWKPNDTIKSLKECLQTLVKVVCGDGNLLFNVGPRADGRIEPLQVERLNEMGQWLANYGDSIYGTRGGPFVRAKWGGAAYKGNAVYLHILDPQLDTLKLPGIDKKIVGHEVLTGGTATVNQQPDSIEVSVPNADRQEIDTIVVLKLDGPAAEVKVRHP